MSYIRKPLHLGISVYNMEESLAWYAKNLGFRPVKDDGYVPPLDARICFIERDGFQLELFEYKSPKPFPKDRLMPDTDIQTVGTKHLAFAVNGLETMKRELTGSGVEIAHETQMNGDHVVFIRDCNGILIELIEQAADGEASGTRRP